MYKTAETLGLLLLVLPLAAAPADETQQAQNWKAGVASAKITPERLHMAGYAGRKEPAEGAEQDLFGKATAFEDRDGNRVVFVALDLISVIEELRTEVATQVAEKYKLAAARFADEHFAHPLRSRLWTRRCQGLLRREDSNRGSGPLA